MELIRILSIPTMIIISTIGTVGNLLIITYYGSQRFRYLNIPNARPRRQKNYHAFLVHLAVADLMACIFIPVYYLPQEINGRWYYGRFLCRYTVFAPTGITVYTSCWILLGIIYERYRSIVHPFKQKISTTLIHLFCTGGWALSVAVHAPYFMATEYRQVGRGVHFICVNNIMKRLPQYFVVFYFALRLIIQCVLPVVLMTFFYTRILRVINRSKRFVKMFTLANYTTTESTVDASVVDHTRKNKAVLNALRNALFIFAVTAILNNMAHVVRAVLSLYFPGFWKRNKAIQMCLEICIRMLFINNVGNCFIYAGTMKDFKKFVLDVLTCCKRLRGRTSSITSTCSTGEFIQK